ncbi:alanine--tRNA ligase [Chloroflexota bacterium]
MTSDEIRLAFLQFFYNKGHKIIPGSSLIPKNDSTLLLTTAGMVQFKPYFLSEISPPSPRLASCQKCFRTTDIESVGDTTHLTFFEMLGNFSIGDYFKPEAISWAWEFITQYLKIPLNRLWITIFLDDEESFHCWRDIGVPKERILKFGEKDNFWGPAGDSGPCGPCSEIHYDFGDESGCGKVDCAPGCPCGRFSEIWNLVFTQYNQSKDGHRTSLPRPNIDTGMGLERTIAVVQGKKSIYETDIFIPSLEYISKLTSNKYGIDNNTDHAIRVIVEHSRGIVFLIGDGVFPDNEGRGYVLRRLLRRTSLFGRRLGLYRSYLTEIANIIINQLGHIYPELLSRQDSIIKVIEIEESRFSQTLNTGLELLDKIIADAASQVINTISGQQAFKLYDTYGFPIELTQEITGKQGLAVDLEGFNQEMKKQRNRARKANLLTSDKGNLSQEASIIHTNSTEFVGFRYLKYKSFIKDILFNEQPTKTISKGQEAILLLETTPFYNEMGGQVGDTGQITSVSGNFLVTSTSKVLTDVTVHHGHVNEGRLTIGEEVEATVDEERRMDISRNHTATHLLQASLRLVLGKHVQQRGSLVTPNQLRFDFSHLTTLTHDELQQVQQIVNEFVRQDLTVYDETIPYNKAIEAGALALFGEKYGDTVRLLKIGKPPISIELCGGTHVCSTGEIGYFHINSTSSIGSGLKRIIALTGRGAEIFIERRLSDLEKTAKCLETEIDGILEKAYSLTAELKNECRQRQTLERERSKNIAESLLSQVETINQIQVLATQVTSASPQTLREMSDLLKSKLRSVIIVLGTIYEDKPAFLAVVTPDLIVRGYNASMIINQVAGITGGGGGGKPGLAQAGGKNKDKLGEALRLVKSLI